MRLALTPARFWWILAAAVGLTRPAAVAAEWVLMNFEGVGDYASVDDYYGSYDGGPLYGIVFDGAQGIVHGGATTLTDKEPSFPTVVSFSLAYGGHYLTTKNGFTGLSFEYASQASLTVSVYDGADKSGNILASATLPATDLDGGLVDVWTNFTLSFSGLAKSAAFPQHYSFFADDIWVQLVPPPPTKPPTKSPTKRPTKSPVKPPTKSPVKPPTSPVKRPTKIPVRRPRRRPRKRPTKIPTRKPRPRPRRRPSRA
jgi:hypothetical protein